MTSGQRGLGKALGVSAKTAHKYVNDHRWRLGKGPWSDGQLEQARDWRRRFYPAEGEAAEEAGDGLPKDPTARAKLDLLVKRAAKLEIENTLALGGYLRKDEVERERVERVAVVRQELGNIRLLALKLNGKDVPAAERILEDWARGVCNKFASRD